MRFPVALVVALAFGPTATSALAQGTAPAPTPPPAAAQPAAPAPTGPTVRVGATFFADYSYFTSPEATDSDGNTYHPNAFNVVRTYINVTGSLNKVIAFRFTPDIAQETGTGSSLNGSLVFRIKYAWLQANLDQWTTAGTWLRFGLQSTPFVNFEEDVYRYRFQGPIFVDREGYLSSSDAGVSFHYNLPGNYGDFHAGFFNGDTFRRTEVNDQKALVIRGTVRPFAKQTPVLRGLRLTGFYHDDHYVKNADRTRTILGATFEHKYVNAGAHHLSTTDQVSVRAAPVDASGYSLWVTPRTTKGWEGLVRYDHLLPNTSIDGQTKNRTIVGGAYWMPLPANVSTVFLLDYERIAYDVFTPARPTEQRWALHVQITF